MPFSSRQRPVLWEYREMELAYKASESRQGQKLRNFGKKIIALAGFDDYYNSFTCKD